MGGLTSTNIQKYPEYDNKVIFENGIHLGFLNDKDILGRTFNEALMSKIDPLFIKHQFKNPDHKWGFDL